MPRAFTSSGGHVATGDCASRTYGGASVHAATQIGSDQFSYDANGNQQYKYNSVSGSWRYLTWDEEDRLSYAFTPSTTTGFQYDAGGARTHKTDYSETTLYPSAYVTIRNGTEVTKHIWAGGERVGSVVRPVPGYPPSDREYWVHSDHLGGGHYVTTKVGAVYEQAERLPFGESWVENRAGTDRVSASFGGSSFDEESGLHYHGARYYDAREARWASRDPALEEYMLGGGVFDSRNLGLYNYAFNSPVSYWDPDGRQSQGNDGGGNSSASSAVRPPDDLCEHAPVRGICDAGQAPIVVRPQASGASADGAAAAGTRVAATSGSGRATSLSSIGSTPTTIPAIGTVLVNLAEPARRALNDSAVRGAAQYWQLRQVTFSIIPESVRGPASSLLNFHEYSVGDHHGVPGVAEQDAIRRLVRTMRQRHGNMRVLVIIVPSITSASPSTVTGGRSRTDGVHFSHSLPFTGGVDVVVLNGAARYRPSDVPPGHASGTIDLQYQTITAAHELGHVLRLRHCDVAGQVPLAQVCSARSNLMSAEHPHPDLLVPAQVDAARQAARALTRRRLP